VNTELDKGSGGHLLISKISRGMRVPLTLTGPIVLSISASSVRTTQTLDYLCRLRGRWDVQRRTPLKGPGPEHAHGEDTACTQAGGRRHGCQPRAWPLTPWWAALALLAGGSQASASYFSVKKSRSRYKHGISMPEKLI